MKKNKIYKLDIPSIFMKKGEGDKVSINFPSRKFIRYNFNNIYFSINTLNLKSVLT
jgi:hypothetical protein